MTTIKNGFCEEINGWKYMSIRGTPKERGFAHGFFVATDFKEMKKTLEYVVLNDYGETWDFFIEAASTLYKDKIRDEFNEFYDEMDGIAEGIKAGGTDTSVDEIIAWNNYFALTENWYPNRDSGTQHPYHGEGGSRHHGEGGSRHHGERGSKGQEDRCSAFMAVGDDYTKDGKIVCAHNNFSNFVDGQFANCVIDIQCEKGHRILYQAFAGFIWSGTDFFVTSAGIIGTETTIGGFLPFENNLPISCRIRKAMQYGNTLDEYVEILLKGNSGDYANSWIFGSTKTNEIMLLELGLKYHNVKRTKNGYFIGFNAPYDPRIRNLECNNSGFDDIRRHQGARRVRLDDLIQEHKGKINIDVAKEIIADHYDVYLNKENPCSRTCCAHYDLDGREYMSDPSRPKPFQPRGALDGCVVDSAMAEKMSFELRYGNSCGTPFVTAEFCDKNRQWSHLKPYLRNRPTQPWTVLAINDEPRKQSTMDEQKKPQRRRRARSQHRRTRNGKKTRKSKQMIDLDEEDEDVVGKDEQHENDENNEKNEKNETVKII